ncbi:MAG: hypothetical protein QM762_23420 [Chryseolinea sp.]
MKRLSWFVFFSIFTISCLDQPDCYQLNNNVIGLGFSVLGGSADYFEVKSVTTDGYGQAWDTVGTSNLGIYLNPYANEMSFEIEGYFGQKGQARILDKKKVNLSYKSQVQFVSKDCGERHVFSDVKVTYSDFDSVRVLNSVPTTPATVNLEFLRCPITNTLSIDFVTDLPVKSVQAVPYPEVAIDKTISGILLSLNLEATTTTYIFKYSDNAPNDTLAVTYNTTNKRPYEGTCDRAVYVDQIKYDSAHMSFTTAIIKATAISDLPKVNFELTR